ncbi:MAG: exopolysaccharide Pel transporter PelG, partial [Candidatus Omnitrophota bacterium]
MAGIGFNLQKILENDTYFASFKAYFYSAVIAAGPWILSILTLFSLTYFAPDNISLYEVMSFRGVIIYIFAFSLIAVGLFQFPLTRYLADRLFLGERETVLPVFNAAALVLVVMQLASGLLYVALGEGDWHTGILAVMVYIAVSMIWLCMIFLSALKAYRTIAASYLAGSALAIGSSLVLGHERGLDGYLLGYLAGHLLIVVLWSARLYREFRSPYLFDFQFLSFTWKNKRLMATGFLYALGIWIDKIVFWLSPQATQVAPLLRLMPLYDSATFLAYLTMIPSLCLFL